MGEARGLLAKGPVERVVAEDDEFALVLRERNLLERAIRHDGLGCFWCVLVE